MRRFNTLIVEDSKLVQKVYEMFFEKNKPNHELTFASTAEMALDLYNNNHYDIILTDMVLDGRRTGLDFLKAINKDKARLFTKVLIVTGQAKEGMSKIFFNNGADDVCFKPIKENDLFNRVSSMEQDLITINKLGEKTNDMDKELSFIEEKNSFITIGEATRDIMHEINNSLSLINLCVEKISLDDDSVEKHGKTLNMLRKAVGKIEDISTSIKQHGSNSRDKEQVNLKEAVDHSVNFCISYLKKAGVELVNSIDSDLEVCSNYSILEQVITNLVKNSCEALETKDEKWIKIYATKDEDDVILKVVDSGRLTQEVENKLFKETFTTKGTKNGTGIGLTISKKLLNRYGANISAKNENENTCFSIRLPIVS